MDKTKQLGQVMTPNEIAEYMIKDILNLSSDDIKNKLFLDNSCGDGIFVKALLNCGIPANHIYACDIDQEISLPVKALLPESNFYLGSYFDRLDWINKFDFVIGNPPYVRIHNILPEIKAQISNFNFCFGMYDLYYAFYEFGLKCLNDTGTLLYISPSGFIKNASGKKIREYIENHNLLSYFEDFSSEQKFVGYSTYTCIVMLSKSRNSIPVPWENSQNKIGLSFSSLQNGIATNADDIFISDNFNDIEQELTRPILKASTGEIKECIFPPATEEELKKYPKAYKYLLSHKEELESRSLSKNTPWFAFGRNQGLKNIDNEKIAIATSMPNQGIKYFRIGKEFLVYSGLYATSDNLDKLEEELKSETLLNYLILNGKPMHGGYTQINATLLKNY